MQVPDSHSQGFEALSGRRRSLLRSGLMQPSDHISYNQHFGFSGIMAGDKTQWFRKYPHIRDFDTEVDEAKAWLSRHWNDAFRAKQDPRRFLDSWLAGDWMAVAGNKRPEIIHNPEQLSEYIEEYFKADELIQYLMRGKHDGFADSLAAQRYDKALGHAVKLRSVVPDFPTTPETTGKAAIDLRRLQEWCVECDEVVSGLYAKVARADVERALALVRELADLLKSGFPTMDETAGSKCRAEVRDEIERLLKVIEELGEPDPAFSAIPARDLKTKAKRWFECVNWGREQEPLLAKMREHGLRIPEERAALTEMLFAAELVAGVDWDRVRELAKATEGVSAESMPVETLAECQKLSPFLRIAEDRISLLTWKRYCQENPEYDSAVREADQHMRRLYNELAAVLNASQPLLQIATLREDKLCQAIKRLNRRLFEDPGVMPDDSDPLRDITEELEAIGEFLRDEPKADKSEPPKREQSGRKIGRPPKNSDEKLRLASAAFDKFRVDCADDKEAWSKVADFYDFPTEKAAKQACHRYTLQQNKTQN